jgi:SH3-like domain-containing protein
VKISRSIIRILLVSLLGSLFLATGCSRGKLIGGDPAYVAAEQANLRDRLSAVYNKAGVVKNGEKVQILEKNRRFVRIRSPRNEEGWIEARYLVGPEVADAFEKMQKDNANTPVQAHGVTRAELNMHTTPGRDTDHLYRLDEAAKVEILKRAIAEKKLPYSLAQPTPTAKGKQAAATPKAGAKPAGAAKTDEKPAGAQPEDNTNPTPQPVAPPKVYEDWFLVRDAQRRTGWVLARMVDIDIPLEIAQYAEGQRIVACFVLNQVLDVNDMGQSRQMPQYLMILNQPKDGTPWDFNQFRVFTFNAKRHRYETSYRERDLVGVFPVTVGHEDFANEGNLPMFIVRSYDEHGKLIEKKYRLNQPIVRRVLSPEEQRIEDAKKAERLAQLRQQRATRLAALRAARPAAHRAKANSRAR